MHTGVFHINKHSNATIEVDTAYSFRKFKDDIGQRRNDEKTIKGEFYKLVLDRFKQHPELVKRLTAAEIVNYTEILELVYAVVSPAIADENKFYWAIGSAIPGEVVYSTESFFKFIKSYHADKKSLINQDKAHFKKRQEDFFYRLVLEKLYNISSDLRNDIVYTQLDEERNLEKYFKIHIDSRFVAVTTDGPLPELNPSLIEQFLHEDAGPEILMSVIPPNIFKLDGFSLITIEDVTAAYSIEKIKLALVDNAESPNELFAEVGHHLQTLTNHSSIEFSLLPFLKINGNLVLDSAECFSSILINAFNAQKIPLPTYRTFITDYIKNPRAVFYNEIQADKLKDNLTLTTLHAAGVLSYALLPVYYNHSLTGVLEIYSKKNVIHFERLLSKLEAAVPLLSQLLHNSIEQFNARIQAVIKENFTTLQKSVEWKFTEAAWNYIKAADSGNKKPETGPISFSNVYPVYGAIDIRNSTLRRNEALQKDLQHMLTKVVETLSVLPSINKKTAYKKQIRSVNRWINKIAAEITDNDEMHIRSFVQAEIHPLMDNVRQKHPASADIIDNYFDLIDEKIGEGFLRRRELEHSMNLINKTLNNYFEGAQKTLQHIYPCYFEKFRTDGVEYDIYAGQEIAPHAPFNIEKIQHFRKWQLQSMIEIVKLTDKLKAKMDCKLDTTQLIFVHSNPIDICFRKDERRFDVEGTYNIRYEVLKKRIDKVLIKGTDERLTQPGMIAIVYFDDTEADEFIGYIAEAKERKLLTGRPEFLDLEELQGVTGLKALRVKVNLKS